LSQGPGEGEAPDPEVGEGHEELPDPDGEEEGEEQESLLARPSMNSGRGSLAGAFAA